LDLYNVYYKEDTYTINLTTNKILKIDNNKIFNNSYFVILNKHTNDIDISDFIYITTEDIFYTRPQILCKSYFSTFVEDICDKIKKHNNEKYIKYINHYLSFKNKQIIF
jgi:hypothetical protein